MAFLSYRDPNLLTTLDVFASAADALERAHITQEDILQALIGRLGYGMLGYS
jgi:Zn-dependent M16 (insulinase) family peptidase